MAKKKGGLPAKYIKAYGMTAKAWREYKAGNKIGKTKRNISTKTPTKRRKTMAKKNKRKRSPNYTRKFDSSMRMLTRVAPYAMSHTGVEGMGYNVVEPVKSGDYGGAVKNFFVNTLLLHTGYDAIAGGWNFAPLGVNIVASVDIVGKARSFANRMLKMF